MNPRAGTSSRQPRFTDWLHLGISKPSYKWQPSQITLQLRQGALGKTQVAADLGLHHLGNPKANAHSRQLQTTSEHHHPAPVQLILHGGRKLVVSDHRQTLQLTGLGKSLPLNSQQQPRLKL